MRKLVFIADVTCRDKKPIHFREYIINPKGRMSFRCYPLTLLEVYAESDYLLVDGQQYAWENLPLAVKRSGRHITQYREIIEETITITIDYLS